MNRYAALAALLRPYAAAKSSEAEQPTRLLPRTPADELPPYREQLYLLDGPRRRELNPSWTRVPADRL